MANRIPASMEAQLRQLAPFACSRDSPTVGSGLSDSVAIETLTDSTGLNTGAIGRVFVLRPERYEVTVVGPDRPDRSVTVLCSPAPLFSVCSLRVSPDGALLAIYGPQGAVCISVMGVGVGADSGGRMVTRRPAVLLDLTASTRAAALTQLKWLGSDQTVLLATDNTAHMRQVAIAGLETDRVTARHLPSSPGPLVLHQAPSREERALREFPVDVASAAATSGDGGDATELFFLMGNGDVLWTDPSRRQVLGPLRWNPATTDNYGCDFCALQSIEAGPLRLLVVATTSGQLYHCLVLRRPEEAAPLLLTYDAVDLSLQPAVQLCLRPDPLLPTRYFAVHEAGVHVVHLPWLPELLQTYRAVPSDPEEPAAATVVEHALCLRPTPTRSSPPLAGFALLGPATGAELLCVDATGDVLRCRVRLAVASPEPTGPLELKEQLNEAPDQVESQMQRLLAHDAFPPLVVRGLDAAGEAGVKECLDAVTRLADNLRRQYLDRFEAARTLLRPRVQLLEARRAAQANQLAALEQEQQVAAKEAELLLFRVGEAMARGEHLREKLQHISGRVARLFPRASRAEEKMADELRQLGGRVAALRQWLERTSDKQEYCSRLLAEERRQMGVRATPGSGGGLQTSLVRHVKPVLKEEGDRIGELIHKLRGLQSKVQPRA